LICGKLRVRQDICLAQNDASTKTGSEVRSVDRRLLDQAVVLMRGQLQRAGDYPLSADPWMIHQRGRRLAEPLVHPGGSLRVISGDVVPDVEAVLQRLGRPYDSHDW